MPGRNPAEAIANYTTPLQQSLSCFTRSVIRPTGYQTDELLVLTFAEPTVELLSQNHEIMYLSFVQHFSVEKRTLFPYKVRTRAYYYTLENEDHAEILGFHWHPETTPQWPFPHLHICEGAARDLRPEIREIHFNTARISFEEFGLMLLHHFHVEPERNDAEAILTRNLDIFKRHRSWSSH